MSLSSIVTAAKQDPGKLYIIPFGGCGEFGLNMTAYVVEGKVYIVDCGQMFPDPHRLGVEGVIADVNEWFTELGGIEAYFITHGHEDHIGALPYILPRWPAPVYAPPWALKLIESRWQKRVVGDFKPTFHSVVAGDEIRGAHFSVSYLHINHSIPHTCSLLIKTKGQTVFHTGDFKLDSQAQDEPSYDSAMLERIGTAGVDLMVCDSTNAGKQGFGPGEAAVAPVLTSVLEGVKNRCFITTFSSNLWRIKTVIRSCAKLGRRLAVVGSGLEGTLGIAEDLGLLSDLPRNVLIDANDSKALQRIKDLVVLATGSQGEYRASLPRIIYDNHKSLRLQADDTIVFSSRIIPGNEKQIFAMMSDAERQGARIITERSNPNIHVSGHAYGGEIETLITLLKPRCFIPVHGTFIQMKQNLNVARPQLNHAGDAQLVANGDVICLSDHGLEIVDHIEIARCFIDGGIYQPIDAPTLRQRLLVGETGLAVMFGVIKHSTGKWLVRPSINIRGLSITNEPAVLEDAAAEIMAAISYEWQSGNRREDSLNEAARLTLRRFLTNHYRRKPVVISDLKLI